MQSILFVIFFIYKISALTTVEPSPTPSTLMTYEGSTAYYTISSTAVSIINSALASIPLNINNLIITLIVDSTVVNLSYLSHKMSVEIKATSCSYAYLAGGDIRFYVSELTIRDLPTNGIRFSGTSTLIVDKLNLINSGMITSYSIDIKYLVVDYNSIDSINRLSSNSYAEQISLILNSYSQGIDYLVSFDDFEWRIYNSRSSSSYISVPYQYSSKLGLIGITNKYEFRVKAEYIIRSKPVNITLIDSDSLFKSSSPSSLKLLEDNKINVELISSGEWKGIQGKTDIYFTSYSDYVVVNSEKLDSQYINLIQRSIESPSNPEGGQPYPTAIATRTPSKSPFPTSTPHPSQTPSTIMTYEGDIAYFAITSSYSSSSIINLALGSIPLNINKLIITLEYNLVTIDFTYLSHRMSVEVKSYVSTNIYDVNFVGGDIRPFVSELTVRDIRNGGIGSSTSNVLTVERLNLINSLTNNCYYNVQYFTADLFSMKDAKSRLYRFCYAEQVSLILDSYSPNINYRVSFNNDEWEVYKSNHKSVYFSFPYKNTSRFGLIGISDRFDLHIDNEEITTTKPVNITLFNSYSRLLETGKFTVRVSTSGQWTHLSSKTNVYLTSYSEYAQFDKSECDLTRINTFENEIVYPHDGVNPPYPTPKVEGNKIRYDNDKAYLDINIKCEVNYIEECYIDREITIIPTNINQLIISVYTNGARVNLSKITHKMSVQINMNDTSSSFYLVGGNVEEFVSELTLINFSTYGIYIENDNLTVGTLNLINSRIRSSSNIINFTILAADFNSLSYINLENIKAEQVSLILDSYSPANNQKIVFTDTFWRVYSSSGSLYRDILYEYASTFGLIGISSIFELNIVSSSTRKTKAVNITLIDFNSLIDQSSTTSVKLLGEYKHKVQIITTGYWSNINNVTDVYFNSYENYVDLNTNRCDLTHVNLTRSTIKYSPNPQDNPYPTPLPSPTPSFLITFEGNTAKYSIVSSFSFYDIINSALASIPSNIDKLFISLECDFIEIDFRYLSHKMTVEVNSTSSSYYVNFIGGDIRPCVSELTVRNMPSSGICVTGNSNILYVEKLNLINCRVDIGYISMQHLTADYESMKYITSQLSPDCKADQITLIFGSEQSNLKIEFYGSILRFYNSVGSSYFSIGYQYASKFGVIGIFNKFDFYVASSSTTSTKPVNITLLDSNLIYDPSSLSVKLLDEYKFPVQIVTTGDWSGIKEATDVYYASYENYATLNTDLCDLTHINLIRSTITYPPNPQNNPYPTPKPSPTPSTLMTYDGDTAYFTMHSLYPSSYINSALASIPLNINKLIITLGYDYATINFAYLTHKMQVEIEVPNSTTVSYVNIVGGDIRLYVSELTIRSMPTIRIRITGSSSTLYVDKLNLINTEINIGYINVKYLLIDVQYVNSMQSLFASSFYAEQISLNLEPYSSLKNLRVIFTNEKWRIYNGDTLYGDIDYKYAAKLDFIGIFDKFELNAESSSVTITKPINIRFLYSNDLYNSSSSIKLLDSNKFPVKIITTGDWRNVKYKADVYFASYEDYIDVNTDQCDLTHINLIRSTITSPPNPQNNPYPTPKPSPTPSTLMTYDGDTAKFTITSKTEEPINSALSSIPSNIKKLIITLGADFIPIDFTYLPHIMSVEVQTTNPASGYNVYFIGGDIRLYVSELTVRNLPGGGINVNNPATTLIVDKVNLINCKTRSNYIYAKYLTADYLSMRFVTTHLSSTAEQISLILNSYSPEINYNVSFDDCEWKIYDRSKSSFLSIPYKYSSKLGLIGITNRFEFNVENEYITKTKPVNITLLNPEQLINSSSSSLKLLQDSKFYVELISNGNWKGIQGKTDIYFTSYSDYVVVNSEKLDSQYINLIQRSIESPSNPEGGQPYPTAIATRTPSKSPFPTNTPHPSQTPSTIMTYEGDIAYFAITSSYSSSSIINLALGSIPLNINKLIITLEYNPVTIDFTYLSHRMSVEVKTTNESSAYNVNFVGGDIRPFVSELTVRNLPTNGITISGLSTTLTVDKLNLINCQTKTGNYKVQYLASDYFSLFNIVAKGLYPGSYPEQISLILDPYPTISKQKIEFTNSEWKIYDSTGKGLTTLLYSKANKLGIIGITNKYEFNVNNSYITRTKPINITLIDPNWILDPSSTLTTKLLDVYKFPVEIVTTGNWGNIDEKTDVYFSLYENYVGLNTSQCDLTHINLIQNTITSPSNPQDHPYPVPSETPHPTKTIVPPYVINYENDVAYLYIFTTSSSLYNSVLRSIPSAINHLIITLQINLINIDFTYLSHKMSVEVVTTDKNSDYYVYFVGADIRSYVSILTVRNLPNRGIRIRGSSTLIVDHLNLINCRVYIGAFNIKYLAADCFSMNYMQYSSDCIPEQVSFIIDTYSMTSSHKIESTSSEWRFYDNNYSASLLYSRSPKLGIIGITNKYELYINPSSTISTTQPINITLIDPNWIINPTLALSAKLLDDYKFPVEIVTTGDWSYLNEKTDVYFSSYENYVTLDTSQCDFEYINLIRNSIENPANPQKYPYPSPSQSPSQSPTASMSPEQTIGYTPYPTPQSTQTPMATPSRSPIPCFVENCFSCSERNSSLCTLCNQGFNLETNCKSCEDNYYMSTDSSTNWPVCNYCGYGCKSCSNSSVCEICDTNFSPESNCKQCIDGYYMKSYTSGIHVCLPCGIGCSSCKNAKTCSAYKEHFNSINTCEVGYFIHLLNETTICDECPDNCESCSSSNSCNVCKEGYTNPSGKCEKCDSGYYKKIINETLSSSQCLSCPSHCLNCTNSTHCTRCRIGYINTDTISTCDLCDSSNGYISVSLSESDSTFECRQACENDTDCGTNFVCKSNSCVCESGYTGDTCQECADGYMLGSTNKCDTCYAGFFKLEEEGTCVSCSDNCLECSTNTACSLCEYGYILTSEYKCIQQNAVVLEYQDPELTYIDEDFVNKHCLQNQGTFEFNENTIQQIPSAPSNLEKDEVLRVDVPSGTSITSIKLGSSSVGLYLDLTDARISQPITVEVIKNQQQAPSSLKFNDNSNVILNINDVDSISNISIIGGNQITLKLVSNQTNESTLLVGSISPTKNTRNNNEPFLIESNVPIIIDSINLYGSLSVKAADSSKVLANKVNVKQAATSNIENIHINEMLEIGSFSQIRFNSNAILDGKAKISVNYSSKTKTEFASMIGKLSEKPPQSFTLKLDREFVESLEEADKFLLAQGDDNSSFSCNEWQSTCASTIKSSDEFNDCQCLANNDDLERLYAVVVNSKEKSKSKMKPGVIAAIVIVCILVVAAVVFLVLFVIMRRNRSFQTNDVYIADDDKEEESMKKYENEAI